MLTNEEHPVAWALLACDLTEARTSLEALVEQMNENGRIDEIEFGIQLAHVYGHLNRAWNARDDPQFGDGSQELFVQRSQFPSDLPLIG
jgi:hypothetical protein